MEKQNKKNFVPKHFYEPACSPERPVYEWQVDDEGHHILVEVGVENFDEEIQRWESSCDIKIIVDRMMKGDPATIAQLAAPGAYGDVNDFPQEVHPAASAQALHQLYENQPDSVKEKYPTYELFEKFFVNLTEATIAQMYAPQESAESEVNNDGE